MNKSEAGRLGGRKGGPNGGRALHRLYGLAVCPFAKVLPQGYKCINPMVSSGFHESNGNKGATSQHNKYKSNDFRKWGRMGGRGKKKEAT